MKTATLTAVRLSGRALQKKVDGFVRSLKNHQPETRGTYQRALREFVRWCARDQRFRFRVEDVRRYKTYLTRKKKLSAVSVSTYLTAVRRLCDYLVRMGVIGANPAKAVGGNKRPVMHSRQVISPQDVLALLASVQRGDERGLRDFAFIKLMLGCALSEIEIIRADMRDLQRTDDQTVLYVQGKGCVAKDDSVTLPADVADSIDQYLAVCTSRMPDSPLFTSAGNRTRGQRMTTRGVRDRVNYYLELAGIKQGRVRIVTPYSLRHTAARMMAEAGATADEIRRRLRLGSAATAMLYINQTERSSQEPEHQLP